MPQPRLSMRKIREVLRLKWGLQLADRKIARSLGVSRSSVADYIRRAAEAGLSWPLADELDDAALDAKLFPPPAAGSVPRPLPDWGWVNRELRKKGVTLQLLWLEYKEDHPDGYQYSQFCELFRRFQGKLDLVMRQDHRAGEKVFVDYAGMTLPILSATTGEIQEAQLFVGVLGASNYTFAEATWTQTLQDWLGSHVRMFEFFGGVPEVVVPDQLRSGVKDPCYYEPDLNPSYQELAAHYGISVIPARPRHPKDKAKAEAGVLLAERCILARLRNRTFFTLHEANQEVKRQLEQLNDRPFKKMDGCRRLWFEQLDKPALRPLPCARYEYGQWQKALVNIDYHIEVDRHYYSVHHSLRGKQMEVRKTATTVEVFFKRRRVAVHVRSFRPGGFTTLPDHMPRAHRAHLEWTPDRLVHWGHKVGPQTAELVRRILDSRPHPEQGYRSCLGIMRLEKEFSRDRLEAAAHRALCGGALSYRSVHSILQKGLDRLQTQAQAQLPLPIHHANVRGPGYYSATHDGGDHAA